MKTKIKLLSQLFVISALMFGCSDDVDQIVPYAKVRIDVDLALPQFSSLNYFGNAIIFPNEGYNNNGVIIYRLGDDFYAFDATCPQHVETKTAITLENGNSGSNGQATCSYCNVTYSLYSYGTASKGYPLKQYSISKTGATSFYVYN